MGGRPQMLKTLRYKPVPAAYPGHAGYYLTFPRNERRNRVYMQSLARVIVRSLLFVLNQ